jgi:hypothetical protein
MAKPKDVPSYIADTWKILQKHYNNYMDSGGSHAEYCAMNFLSARESDSLFKEYRKAVTKRKKS